MEHSRFLPSNVGVPGERLETNPNAVFNGHFCQPLKRSAVVGDQMYLEQRDIVSTTGKGAQKAHHDALQAVETTRFALTTEAERNDAKDQMANVNSRKRGYLRARKEKYPVVLSILDIPEELSIPWSSRFAHEGDESFGQSYLLYQDDTPGFRMAIFSSPDNLEKLHQSMHWVSDGNYKYRQKGMQQMYSIHGFIEAANGLKEAKTLVVAIMESGTQEMFDRLFGNWMNNRFGLGFWNYFRMGGPRTTNHAESWHSTLKDKFDGMRIDLGVWLTNFQTIHHEEAVRTRQLVNGLAEPRQRRPAYLENDARIGAAKVDIYTALCDWSLRRVGRSAAAQARHDNILIDSVQPFLRNMGYLIGCKNMGKAPRRRLQPEDIPDE